MGRRREKTTLADSEVTAVILDSISDGVFTVGRLGVRLIARLP